MLVSNLHHWSITTSTYNPAESKPRITLYDIRSHVSTMVALTDHSFVSGHFLAEGMLTAYKEEEHGEDGLSILKR